MWRDTKLKTSIVFSILMVWGALLGCRASAQPVRATHLTVELVSETTTIAPGRDFLAGLHFVLDKGWHIYWINAGDAGEPPRVEWQLPEGITAGNLQFPAPQRLPLGPLMDFGYENEVLLPVPMRADSSVKPGSTEELSGELHFLVCSNVCIPGKAKIAHKITVAAQPGKPDRSMAALFSSAERHLPRSLPAGSSVSVTHAKAAYQITLRTGQRIASAEFYPFDQNVIANAAPQTDTPLPNGIRIAVPKAQGTQQIPTALHGLIKLSDGTSFQFTSPVTAGPASGQRRSGSLLHVLALAFLGGVVLNLMPCVFPVLFIKGLSLVQSSGEERKSLRVHGIVYTGGILVSFWAIVAVLLLLRAGGAHLGWGFQFQSPYFVAFMALLLFFLGLSLAGQFEIGLSATSLGGELAQRGGYSGSFFTGVLATVVATPCTAPFMGAAIGFALSQSAYVSFAVFTALALGLAAPYVLLTLQPAWTRILPRPGAWMEYLKQAVSIPIFATVIWLVWVFAQTVGSSGVAALLAGLLVTAIAGWVLGHWRAKWGAAVVSILLLGAAIALPSVAAEKLTPATGPKTAASGGGEVWQPFSPQQIAADRAKGKPVFVDFSAAWCLSCQVNERVVLDTAAVQQAFQKRGVVTMRADWTDHNDTITAALAQLGRSGVPTYALYYGGPEAQPAVLPEVLTQRIVLNALKQLPAPASRP
ncbi:MAG TPA: protein-disulfide reductase DsbD domain-containing protein [Acidobacteriaceae bacterium]|nr:protein-disulfide reductase DsbD domain-containing protein [Acidobacteriaceae bacterium]